MPTPEDCFIPATLEGFSDFKERKEQLARYEREVPNGADAFFNQLLKAPFSVGGAISRASALQDIRALIDSHVSETTKSTGFFKLWLSDMAQLSELFCTILDTSYIGFWLGSRRGCRRYHTDNVPFRMLVTYAGCGTEWLPKRAIDMCAFKSGEPNEKIIKDISARRFLNPWDVAVLRGGPDGLLHRTPDDALDTPSMFMRLDHPEFLAKVQARS